MSHISATKKERDLVGDIKNKKAAHNFFIEERFEAGIALSGTEVKAIRAGHAQISEAFVKIDKAGIPVLFNANVDEYRFGNIANHAPTRTRRLLLHKSEIRKLKNAVEKDGLTILPLRLFLSHGLIKIEIAICRGKKLFDKRATLKERTEWREAERALAKFRR